MTNVDLLERTLAHIEANPDTWDQSMWSKQTECGTAYCFAGHAVALTYPDAQLHFYSDTVTIYPGTPLAEDVQISETASELLGLDGYESEVLFDANNALDRLRRLVADLAAGRTIDFFDAPAATEAEASR
jgi:hypothetical protein